MLRDLRQKSSSLKRGTIKLSPQPDSLDSSPGYFRQQELHRLTKPGTDEEGIAKVTRHSLETFLWILADPPICFVGAITVFSFDTNRTMVGNDLPARGGSH